MKLRMFFITFIISLIGLVFSLYNIYGAQTLTECERNCSIFADFSFMGLSLWYFGALYFLLIMLLSVFRTFFLSRFGLKIITSTALFADTFLLWIMIKTAPCYFCMFEGLLIFLSYIVCRYERNKLKYFLADIKNSGSRSKNFGMSTNSVTEKVQLFCSVIVDFVKYSWIILFVMLIGVAVNQSQDTSPVTGNVNTATKIYFSPSCKACKELVKTEYLNKNIEWVPVEENAGDIWKIILMQESLKQGKNLYEALLQTEDTKYSPTFFDYFKYLPTQIDIWINTAKVKERTPVVPYIEVFGNPKSVNTSFIGTENTYCGNGSLCTE